MSPASSPPVKSLLRPTTSYPIISKLKNKTTGKDPTEIKFDLEKKIHISDSNLHNNINDLPKVDPTADKPLPISMTSPDLENVIFQHLGSVSSNASGSTGTISSTESIVVIQNTYPKPKNLRFHYHYKDGTRSDIKDPTDSNCSTVYSCDTLRNFRIQDIASYKRELRLQVKKNRIIRAIEFEKYAQRLNRRHARRLVLLKERQKRKRQEKIKEILHKCETVEPITNLPLHTTSVIQFSQSQNDLGRNFTVAKIIQALRGISSDEVSRVTRATMFMGPILQGIPPELRMLIEVDEIFLRHRHCSWGKKFFQNEENIYQILNKRGHKLMHIYEDFKSKKRFGFGSREMIEYSCFNENDEEAMRILAKTHGFFIPKIKMKIYSPPEELIGSVEEIRRLNRPRTLIKNSTGKIIGYISRKTIRNSAGRYCWNTKTIFAVKARDGTPHGTIRGDWIDLQPKLHSKYPHYGIKLLKDLNVISKALYLVASLFVYFRFFNGKLPRREIPWRPNIDEEILIDDLNPLNITSKTNVLDTDSRALVNLSFIKSYQNQFQSKLN